MGLSPGEKNKSVFSVLGWERANCDGPYVLPQLQDRRWKIGHKWGAYCTEHVLNHLFKGGQLSCTLLPSEDAPQAEQVGMPFSRGASKQGTLQGLSRENFTVYQEKTNILVFEISCVADQRREDGVSTPWAQGRTEEEERQACQWHHNIQAHHRDENSGGDMYIYVGFHLLISLPARILSISQNPQAVTG